MICYTKSDAIKPKIITTFFSNFHFQDELFTSGYKILYIEKVNVNDEERFFAIPFGYGHNFLNLDNFVTDFGLKIVLNSCKENSIRKITKVEIGKNYKKSNEQLPYQNSIRYFSVSPEDDLIQDVTAKCEFEGEYYRKN